MAISVDPAPLVRAAAAAAPRQKSARRRMTVNPSLNQRKGLKAATCVGRVRLNVSSRSARLGVKGALRWIRRVHIRTNAKSLVLLIGEYYYKTY